MKKIKTLLLALLCLICLTATAQKKSKSLEKQKKEFLERFQKYRKQHDEFHLVFILKKLELKEEKEKEVTLIYKELLKKRRESDAKLYAAEYLLRLKCFNKKKIEEEDYANFNQLKIKTETEKAKTEKEFYAKFQKILSEKKIYRLYNAEKKYKEDLLNRIRRRGKRKNHKKETK